MPARVLVAKPGLDGHDRGAKLIARHLRDAGFEVIYTGLRQRPEVITAIAIDEDVDIVGLSILNGAHLSLTRKLMEHLQAAGGDDIQVVVGGPIPARDIPQLRELGVAAVFPTGADVHDVVAAVQGLVSDRERGGSAAR